MIIVCPNCKKQFKINPSQIPSEGRDLKCGSCNYVWFYKIEDKKPKPLPLKENIINNKGPSIIVEEKIGQITKTKQSLSQNKIMKNTSGKFFSYLVVLIISFVALIILVDTLKTPLMNVFPGLELILFNLFEILKDIKLFIIDLY